MENVKLMIKEKQFLNASLKHHLRFAALPPERCEGEEPDGAAHPRGQLQHKILEIMMTSSKTAVR
jgi:hypothetical protein